MTDPRLPHAPGRCKQEEEGVLKAAAPWGPRLMPVKSLKRRGGPYQMPGISNSGGTSLGPAMSSTGATRGPFCEFIEFDKICFIFLHKIV